MLRLEIWFRVKTVSRPVFKVLIPETIFWFPSLMHTQILLSSLRIQWTTVTGLDKNQENTTLFPASLPRNIVSNIIHICEIF